MAAPTAAFTVIPLADVDPDSPVTTDLMDALRQNDQNLFAQLVGDPVSSPTFTPAAEHDHDGVNSKILSGPSTALQLIEAKIISTAVTSVTFSGLNSETGDDAIFVIKAKIRTQTGAQSFSLLPNGLATFQSSAIASVGITGVTTQPGLFLAFALNVSVGNTIMISAEVTMRKSFGGAPGSGPVMISQASNGFASPQVISGVWAEAPTAVTSLDIVSSVASGINAGSLIALYRARIS